LQRAVPEVEGLRLRSTPDRKKVVGVAEKNGGGIIEASALSDGVLRFLALLSLVYHPQPPPLICIEEPENGIHPHRLEKVVNLLKWLSTERTPEQRGQVIVTTHSTMFLDWFRDHPEWVWVVERDAEGTHFRSLKDVPHLDQVLDDFSLGEAWYGGSIGGVP
jgi:predicted ATPase